MKFNGRERFFALLMLSLFLAIVACEPRSSSSKGDNQVMTTSDKKDTPVIYVAVGDSTGAGVGAREGGYPARLLKRIQQERANAKLVNLCISGATTDDLLREQLRPAIAARPTLITIGIGINDLGHQVTADRFARNFEEIVKRLKTETSAAIVVSNLPDISFAPVIPAYMRAETRSLINVFNQRISGVIERYKVSLVDAYAETHAIIPDHPEFFSDDGFHPSDAGYEYWAKTMWPAVKAALGE